MRFVVVVGIAAAISLSSFSARANQWVSGNSRSCVDACVDANLSPVVSGIYNKSGAPFYICRANAGEEGKRAGINYEPDWSNACWVGFGGKETFLNTYDCLCTP